MWFVPSYDNNAEGSIVSKSFEFVGGPCDGFIQRMSANSPEGLTLHCPPKLSEFEIREIASSGFTAPAWLSLPTEKYVYKLIGGKLVYQGKTE